MPELDLWPQASRDPGKNNLGIQGTWWPVPTPERDPLQAGRLHGAFVGSGEAAPSLCLAFQSSLDFLKC